MSNLKQYNGRLVKSKDAAIYFVIDGKLHHIIDPKSFLDIFLPGSSVEVYSSEFINSFERGENIGPGPLLANDPASGKVYLIPNSITNKYRHWIINPEVFNACKFDWSKIKMSGVDLNRFTEGVNIDYYSGNSLKYITDIAIIEGNNATAPAGYTKIDLDLNKGTKAGKPIYLCYKKGIGDKITQIIADYYRSVITKSRSEKSGFHKIDFDLNKDAGGDYIYLYYKKGSDKSNLGGVTDIKFVTGKNAPAPSGYKKVDLDLNKGADGEYIYLCYRCEKEPNLITTNWMSKINGKKSIADISIPATHDSVMWAENMENKLINQSFGGSGLPIPSYINVQDMARTQFLNIEDQFDIGVRGFDLRVYWSSDDNTIGMAHATDAGPLGYIGSFSKITFKEAFETLINKLKKYPTEFIIIMISIEADIENRFLVNRRIVDKYKDEVDGLLKKYREYIYIDKGEENMNRSNRKLLPTLDEIRGKIFIVSDAEGSDAKGKLDGGFANDPWRFRYKNNTTKIEYRPKDKNNNIIYDCISLKKTFVEGANVSGDRVHQFKDMAASRNNVAEGLLGRFGVNQAYKFNDKYPREWAIENNSKILEYLRETPSLKRIGVVGFDFIGDEESADLAWEVIKVNPDIRKLN